MVFKFNPEDFEGVVPRLGQSPGQAIAALAQKQLDEYSGAHLTRDCPHSVEELEILGPAEITGQCSLCNKTVTAKWKIR